MSKHKLKFLKKSIKRFVRKAEKEQQEKDSVFRARGEKELRREWGKEFEKNLRGIRKLLSRWLDDNTLIGFYAGRLGNGCPIGDSPAVLKFLHRLRKKIYG